MSHMNAIKPYWKFAMQETLYPLLLLDGDLKAVVVPERYISSVMQSPQASFQQQQDVTISEKGKICKKRYEKHYKSMVLTCLLY